MTSYTIAFIGNLLLASAPDGDDIDFAVKSSTPSDIDLSDGYQTESGLTLVDEVEDGDDVIWSGSDYGYLVDGNGVSYAAAVRRAAKP